MGASYQCHMLCLKITIISKEFTLQESRKGWGGGVLRSNAGQMQGVLREGHMHISAFIKISFRLSKQLILYHKNMFQNCGNIFH